MITHNWLKSLYAVDRNGWQTDWHPDLERSGYRNNFLAAHLLDMYEIKAGMIETVEGKTVPMLDFSNDDMLIPIMFERIAKLVPLCHPRFTRVKFPTKGEWYCTVGVDYQAYSGQWFNLNAYEYGKSQADAVSRATAKFIRLHYMELKKSAEYKKRHEESLVKYNNQPHAV